MKPRYKRRIAWSIISLLGIVALAVVLVPPLVTLNHLKPRIQAAIAEQTGLSASINGSINFSLIGNTTIVAHDIVIPTGTIGAVLFTVPLSSIFNLQAAPLNGEIFIYDAQLKVNQMIPPIFSSRLEIRDSVINFMDKNYEIIQGSLSGGIFQGQVRTNQHKYEFDSNGDVFHITNKANDLNISGHLYSDGSARGVLALETDNINKWFDFQEPVISQPIKVSMDFDWNGQYGFKFSNIRGQNFNGNIELFNDGHRDVRLSSDDMEFDFSFLLGETNVFYDTTFNINFYGKLKFADRVFKHLRIDATGTKPIQDKRPTLYINTIMADDIILTGGKIDTNGAHDILIRMPINGVDTVCLFSGTPQNWKCSEFRYGDMRGSVSVQNGVFSLFIQSDRNLPDISEFSDAIKILGTSGQINFQFSDTGGSLEINESKRIPSYDFVKNKSLDWLGMDLYFLPESMRSAPGDFTWGADGLLFKPHSGRWTLNVNDNSFYLRGTNIKDWFPNIDLQSINNQEYVVSGNFTDQNISNLDIKIAGQNFTGSVTKNNLTLKTKLFNLDSFVNQKFIDQYEELQFLTGDPMLIPFSIPVNISLAADTFIYNGNDFANFLYSLKSDVQTFSITDNKRGNLLATLSREQNKYNIVLQLNKFLISGTLLSSGMPINIQDTMITAEAHLTTSGKIAYDIWQNMSGKVDLSFDGGVITGLGIDNFYAGTDNITTLNAEYALANALETGTTQIKKMRIIGEYNGGNFETTTPLTMSMRHADAVGTLNISRGEMLATIDLVMRGTSPLPAAISLRIMPNGARDYSLSQIMINFDPDFLRDFVKTHNRF